MKTNYFMKTKQKSSDENTCHNLWYSKETTDTYKAIFSLYPKEWLVSEISNYPMKKYDFQ